MQRLDADLDAARLGVRHHRRQAVDDHLPRAVKVAAAFRNAAAHHHQRIGAQRGGFVQRAKIIVDPPLPFFCGQRREHPAAAQSRDAQSGIADLPAVLPGGGIFDLVAPHADPLQSAACGSFDRLAQIGGIARHLVETEPPHVGSSAGSRPHLWHLDPAAFLPRIDRDLESCTPRAPAVRSCGNGVPSTRCRK